MPTDTVILDFDEIMSGADESDGKVLSAEDVFSAQDSGPDDDMVLSESDLYDKFSTEDPESLFRAMKENPGRNYSEEQINTYLSYAVEKDLDIGKVLSDIFPAIIEAGKDYLGGAAETAKLAVQPKGEFVYTGPSAGPGAQPGYFKREQKESLLVSVGEGALRGSSELGLLARSIALADSINIREVDSEKFGKVLGGIPKKKQWSEFTPEQKETARNRFRTLNKLIGDQVRYQRGDSSILSEIAESTASYFTEDADYSSEVGNNILSLVNPRVADFASYHIGPEGAGAKLAGKIKKGTAKGAAGSVASKTGDKGAKLADEFEEATEDFTRKYKDAPFVGDPAKAVGVFREKVARVSNFAQGLGRALGKNSDENVFLRMSRDSNVDPRNRKFAETLGHGVFTDYPWLSPALRMLAKPTKVVAAGAGRGAAGAASGFAMSALTLDEEMMKQSIAGSTMMAFGGGMIDQSVWARKNDVEAAANNWLLKQSPEFQETIKSKFTTSEIARWSVFERWAQKLVEGSTGEADVNFIYTDSKNFDTVFEYLRKEGLDDNINLDGVTEYAEKIASNSASDKIPSLNRGVQFLNTRNSQGRPIALINVDAMSPTTIIHEGIHALGKLDVLQDYFRPIQEYITKKFSPDDLDMHYDDYMRRFAPEDERRLRDYDSKLSDNYNPGTPESNPKYWKDARIKDEIMSDIWESFIENKDPLYMTRADLKTDANKIAKPLGRLTNLFATFLGSTGDPKLLSQHYRDKSGKPVDYGDPQLTAGINNLINVQQRLNLDTEGKVIRGELAEAEAANDIDLGEVKEASVPKNLLVAKLDKDGNYQFDSRGKLVLEKNQKELRKKERLRQNFIRTVFQDQTYRPEPGFGNKVPVNYDPETGTISGDYFPAEAMRKFENAPRWLLPQSQLEIYQRINESIRRNEPIEIDYNARLIPKGKNNAQYSSKVGSSLRTASPFSIFLTKAGNVAYNTLDLGHLSEKYVRIIRDPKRRKAITNLWGKDAFDHKARKQEFDKDLIQYMNNIINPDPELGVLKGLGDEKTAKRKANVLSAFFGFKKKDINFRNNAQRQRMLLEHMNPDRADNLIRTRRADAINAVVPSQIEKMPMTQQGRKRIQENAYQPGLTPDNNSNTRNIDERSETDIPSSKFSIEPQTGGLRFHDGLRRTASDHVLGAAVEVKELGFYRDPETALYISQDGLAGTAVTKDGDLVSVFKHPEAASSSAEMREILSDASEISTTLDAFDIEGFLPNLYAKFGFKPVARVKFNREYAPPGWPYDLAGEPDVVMMVRDPNNVLPKGPENYAKSREDYPLFEDYDEAQALQSEAKRQVVDSGLDPYVRFEPPIKKDIPIIDESVKNQRKTIQPSSETKTRAGFKVEQVLFSKVWKKTKRTVDGEKVEDYHYALDDNGNFKVGKNGKKVPHLTKTRLSNRKGFDMIVSAKPKKAPGTKDIKKPDEFYERLDSAKEFLDRDISAFLDPKGYVEFMTRAGAYGDLLVPPSGLAPVLNNPQQYVDLVKGGYHEDLTATGTIESAMEGLDATVEMRRVIGDTPPPMITAMHHLWGILSRMLPPVHQEAGWLRLVSNRKVLDAIQSSIDGDYKFSKNVWKGIVDKAFKSTEKDSGGLGNNSKANANDFHLMLANLNGKWGEMSNAYHQKNDSTEMGREFWRLANENGAMGIKNKVQRFIGLTFGTPGVIMDRWKYVEFNLPMLMQRLQKDGYPARTPREYFDYGLSGKTPEDPNGIYGTYGAVESSGTSFSLAYYEGIEKLINYSIKNSPELQQLLGKHANAGGLHWVGWNAIKNEAVGHSSLNMTKDIAELVNHADINPETVLNIINSGTYYTEGLNGKARNKVTIENGEFSHE